MNNPLETVHEDDNESSTSESDSSTDEEEEEELLSLAVLQFVDVLLLE